MDYFFLGEPSKLQSCKKAHLLVELVEVKMQLVHKDEKISQLAKRLQRLEEAQARQIQERRLELPRAPRPSMHYGSQEHDGLVHTLAKQHHQPQHSFDFVKLPSFSRSNDPTLYLKWEAKVEHLFNVYKVTEDQKVRLASLIF